MRAISMFILASLLSIGIVHAKDHLWANGEWIADSTPEENPVQILKAKFTQEQDKLLLEVWYACDDKECSLGKSLVTKESSSFLFEDKDTVKAAFFPGNSFLMLTFKESEERGTPETALLEMIFADIGNKGFGEYKLALINPQLKKNLQDEKAAKKKAEQQKDKRAKTVRSKLGKDADDIPCTCVFNTTRPWNPEKIIWKEQFWECAEYKADGTCLSVRVVEGAVVE